MRNSDEKKVGQALKVVASRFKDIKFGEKTCNFIESDNVKNCIQCGNPTNFIEVTSEAGFCSSVCADEWYENYDEVFQRMMDFTEEL